MQIQIINKKKSHTLLISLLFVLGASIFQSCKDKKSETGSGNTNDTTNTGKDTSNGGKVSIMSFKSFGISQLDSLDLIAAFSNGNTKKLLIQFASETAGEPGIRGICYPATKKNVRTSATYINMPLKGDKRWDPEGLVILGNVELSIKEVRAVLGINGPINQGNARTLYFYPLKDADNHIYYFVSKTYDNTLSQLIMIPSDGIATKPSPPAPPCDENCDQ